MILFFAFVLFLVLLLGYLSLSDIKHHEIPLVGSIIGLVGTAAFVLLNLIPQLTSAYIPGLSDAILGFGVAAGLTALLVILSKERAMGKGDIFLFGIMGLTLGLSNLFTGFLICVYSATLYGIILAVIKKRFHGLEVPMVPFISIGILIALIFHPQIFLFTNQLMNLLEGI